MGFPIAAGIAAGGSILGGLFGKKAADKAADAQVQSGEMAIGEMRRQYDQTRQDNMPWLQAGGKAIGDLYAMTQPGYDHTTSPGYQFRLGEGLRAVENSAAARGVLQSSGTLFGVNDRAQDYAADDFDRSFNRRASIAAGGQQVAGTLGQLGANNSANIGNVMQGQGNARASGYVGQANAMNNMFGNLATIGMYYGDK